MELSAENIQRFKWPISASRVIEAPAHDIWLAISKPGNLEDCHPFCEKNLVYEWSGIGSRDVIHYYSGWVLQREFINWIDGVGYDLVIGREGGSKSYVSWRIMEDPAYKNKLRITIYPYVLQDFPLVMRWLPHILYIQPHLNSYLESVLKGFEWYIRTEKPVVKNQFGSHKWFSTET